MLVLEFDCQNKIDMLLCSGSCCFISWCHFLTVASMRTAFIYSCSCYRPSGNDFQYRWHEKIVEAVAYVSQAPCLYSKNAFKIDCFYSVLTLLVGCIYFSIIKHKNCKVITMDIHFHLTLGWWSLFPQNVYFRVQQSW